MLLDSFQYCVYDPREDRYRCVAWDELQPVAPIVPSSLALSKHPPPSCDYEKRCCADLRLWRRRHCSQYGPSGDLDRLRQVNKAIRIINELVIPILHGRGREIRVMRVSGRPQALGDLRGTAAVLAEALSSVQGFTVEVVSTPGCLWGANYHLILDFKNNLI